MELKTARLTLLIDPNKKAEFERLCAQQDITPSQVVRQMIRDYLIQHGAAYVPSGEEGPPAAPAKQARTARTAQSTATAARAATASRKGSGHR